MLLDSRALKDSAHVLSVTDTCFTLIRSTLEINLERIWYEKFSDAILHLADVQDSANTARWLGTCFIAFHHLTEAHGHQCVEQGHLGHLSDRRDMRETVHRERWFISHYYSMRGSRDSDFRTWDRLRRRGKAEFNYDNLIIKVLELDSAALANQRSGYITSRDDRTATK